MKRKKAELIKMKPYKAWQRVDRKGRAVASPEPKWFTFSTTVDWLQPGQRIIRVLVKEI